MNIVIINSVPLNGGDEALLRATILGIKDIYPESSISVLCNNPYLANKHFNDINFDWDWEYANNFSFISNNILDRLKVKTRKFLKEKFQVDQFSSASRLLSSKKETRVYSKLKKADFIIVSPGGYFHDFYNYQNRLETLNFLMNHLRKRYFFFCQSIGPFWRNENYFQLIEVLSHAEKVILREQYSWNHLRKIGYTMENVVVSNDVAFYLFKKYKFPVKKFTSFKRVAINFREWGFEKEGEKILEKALCLVSYLISLGCKLTFISTCQGVEGYRNDSLFAQKIIQNLEIDYRSSCSLVPEKLTLDELLVELSNQDVYIGMRLHGAILSLVAGIPALNIAYEDKTPGIFDRLGLSDFCFSYKDESSLWIEKTNYFFSNLPVYMSKIDSVREKAAEEVESSFPYLFNKK